MIECRVPDAEGQLAFGALLARLLPSRLVLYLEGDLGTGKTTLARGILAGLGHPGAVRSPTYTLIESYELTGARLHHLDLYRLADPRELDYLGLRDLLAEDAIWVVEWPQRGLGVLPPPDLRVGMDYAANGRCLRLSAETAAGQSVLDTLAAAAQAGGMNCDLCE